MDREENDTKKAAEQAMFQANRVMVLQLQRTEQYLEQNLKEIRAEKEKYLKKLQDACSHGRILEMKDVMWQEHPSEASAMIFRMRVCQICGLREVQRKQKYEEFIRFRDDRISLDKLERPDHSHWTVREYVDLRFLSREEKGKVFPSYR